MGRFSPRTVLNYTALLALFLLSYKIFLSGDKKDVSDPFRSRTEEHPKNVQGRPKHGEILEGEENPPDKDTNAEEVDKEDLAPDKLDVGDMPKDLNQEDNPKMKPEEKKLIKEQFKKHEEPEKARKKEKPFFEDGIDWETEEEMKRRRASFFKTIQDREMEMDEEESRTLHEKDDNFAFVTAGSHSTYHATIQFIFSVQYFYPNSEIGIYDIGLTSDEREFINSLCKTEVLSMWLQLWPEALYKNRHRVWRPLLLQFAGSQYAHFVYVEPGRFVYRQMIKDYIDHSRKHGVVVGGRQLKYSSFVVTNPYMYTFLHVDERKLQKTPHFSFTLMVLHNTNRVQNYFLRYLVACTLEEYCISPPGSKPQCDLNPSQLKRHAKCHRYDESAVNLILNRWHDYKPKEFLMRDVMTRYFDGKDLTRKVKVCNKNIKEEV